MGLKKPYELKGEDFVNSNIEMFYEPIKILDQLPDGNRSDMSENELAFLCGLIKRSKPKKIVEIGVAAGGTTSVILNCIAMLDMKARLYSIDLMTDYYLDKNKKVGYQAEEAKEILDQKSNHTLYTGKYSVECLESIGEDIDLVILDTSHVLPGEIFDFLACYPYLKNGGIVVLHDITLNFESNHPYAYATKLLLDVVVADKYMNLIDPDLRNIAAFRITDDTKKYIEDVFSSLTITWANMPSEKELLLYRNFYSKYYSCKNLEIFNLSVQMNKRIQNEISETKRDSFLKTYKWIETIKNKRIYIYGCGEYGKRLYYSLNKCDVDIDGYIISDGQIKKENDINVLHLSELRLNPETDKILIGVSPHLQKEICEELQNKGINEYIIPDSCILSMVI